MMTSLVPMNTLQELTSWHRDIDELFNRFFGGTETDLGSVRSWTPALETFQKDGQYIIRADLPGIDPKQVDVSIADDVLTIKGERRRSNEVNEKDYHYRETSYGSFERQLGLPKGVDREKMSARYENGVLEVSVPLPATASGRKVPIHIGSTGSEEVKQIKAA